MGLLKNIHWESGNAGKNVIVYKFPMKNDYISKGSVLTVREGQACIFCDKGRMGDVFLPGYYKLDTDSIPIITKLMSWKYGFQNPFRSDVYFVNTIQFTNQKWGTTNPITVRDADYGAVRIRGFGSYAFKVDDPYIFMKELSGAHSSFNTEEITDYLRSMLVSGITDVIGESKIPVLDMAGNLLELSKMLEKSLQPSFKELGIQLTKFNFENFSMPKELEEALDKSTSLGMLSKNMGTYMQKAQADALVEAAKNPGSAGSTMGAGLGMGMGMGMGNMFGNMMGNNQGAANAAPAAEMQTCKHCGAQMKKTAKFCPECGKASGLTCPKCKATVKEGAKFCPECGEKLTASCPSCKAAVKPGAKFCPECGEKL